MAEHQQNQNYDYMVKLLIIGDSGVGKTCLLLRFCQNECPTTHLTTIGIDFKIKTLNVGDKKVKMTIWDTAGQEKFKTITQTYYKGAMGIVLTFAVNERKSFEAIDKWMKQIHENASEDVKIVLVGNKCDLTDREVQYKEGEALAQRYRIRYIETSALENLNVHELFLGIATDIKIHLESAPKPQGSTSSSISGKKLGDDKRGKEKKKKGCC